MRNERYDLRSLFETSRILGASLDLDFVLRNLLLTAMGKLLVTRGMVILSESEKAHYRVAVVKGLPSVKEGETLVIQYDDAQEMLVASEVPPTLQTQGIVLVLSIHYREQRIGLVALGQKATRRPFDKAELEFIQSLVHMSAASVHNSMMVAELRDINRDLDYRVQQLNTLFDLSQEFGATPSRSRVARLFSLALMGQMMVAKHVFFLKRSAPFFEIISIKGVPAPHFAPKFFEAISGPTSVEDSQGPSGVRDTLKQHGLVLALPLKQQDKVVGILCLGPKITGKNYQAAEREFLYSLGNLAVVSIQNTDLVEERIEKERLAEELRLAREIQQSLLPNTLPHIPGIQVATMALPSREVGGDYLDVLALKGRRIHIIIADVTGKGMPAALLMSSIHACTHVMLPMHVSLEEAVSHINRVIYKNTPPDKFITAFSAIYHADSHELEYVNAGHEPPLLVRADGTIVPLEIGGPLLGILPSLPYEKARVQLKPDDLLVMFTDGVTEAMGSAKEEYTDERLQKIVQENRNRNAQELLDLVQKDVESFTGPVDFRSDDRTMVILKAVTDTQVP